MPQNYNNLIDQITEIRVKNNKNWMSILRLAFKHAPKEAEKLMSNITKCDEEISKLSTKLGRIKEK